MEKIFLTHLTKVISKRVSQINQLKLTKESGEAVLFVFGLNVMEEIRELVSKHLLNMREKFNVTPLVTEMASKQVNVTDELFPKRN